MTKADLAAVNRIISDGDSFLKFANFVIDGQVEALDETDDFRPFLKKTLRFVAAETAAEIADLAESPIERNFLRSLLISSLKGGLGILVHRTFGDALREVHDFRTVISNFQEFRSWFEANRPEETVHAFFDEEFSRTEGREIAGREKYDNDVFLWKYYYLQAAEHYHMTLQPTLRNVGGKSIRVDAYFWIPSQPNINVIVEFDGFAFHSGRDTFRRDRQRDRALNQMGFDVLRYAGTEIVRDPVKVSLELVDHLEGLRKKDRRRSGN